MTQTRHYFAIKLTEINNSSARQRQITLFYSVQFCSKFSYCFCSFHFLKNKPRLSKGVAK